MDIVLDVLGGDKKSKFQNDFMHACDVFEKGKQYATYFQVTITGTPDLSKLCENFKNSYEQATDGYVIFVAIRSIDGIRSQIPHAFIKEYVQSISMINNDGILKWGLFKDILTNLGYRSKHNERMFIESVDLNERKFLTK